MKNLLNRFTVFSLVMIFVLTGVNVANADIFSDGETAVEDGNTTIESSTNEVPDSSGGANGIRTADYSVIARCWGPACSGANQSDESETKEYADTITIKVPNEDGKKEDRDIEVTFTCKNWCELDKNEIRDAIKDAVENAGGNEADVKRIYNNKFMEQFLPEPIRKTYVLSKEKFEGKIENFVFAEGGDGLFVIADNKNESNIYTVNGSADGGTIDVSKNEYYKMGSDVYICETCSTCHWDEGEKCSNKVVFSKTGSFPLISQYCKDHVCGFYAKADVKANSNSALHEGLACTLKRKNGSAEFCDKHTCGWRGLGGCNNGICGLAGVTGARYGGNSSSGYSTLCQKHTCKSPGCGKSVFDSKGTISQYCEEHNKKCKYFTINEKNEVKICDNDAVEGTDRCSEHKGLDTPNVSAGKLCSRCKVNLWTIVRIINEETGANEKLCDACNKGADYTESVQAAWNTSLANNTPVSWVEDAGMIDTTESTCQAIGCSEPKAEGRVYCKNHICKCVSGKCEHEKDKCRNQRLDGSTICAACTEAGGSSSSDGGSSSGYDGGNPIAPSTPPSTPTTTVCNHALYPVGTDVTFKNVDGFGHEQTWTCTGCKKQITQEYRHTYINGTCLCGRKSTDTDPATEPGTDPATEPETSDENKQLQAIFGTTEDLSAYKWALTDIKALVDERILSDDNMVAPLENIETKELLNFLGKVAKRTGIYQQLEDRNLEIFDEDAGDVYYTYIMKAFGNAFGDQGVQGKLMVEKIFNGKSDWAGENVSREKMLALVGSLLYKPATDTEATTAISKFADRNDLAKSLKPYVAKPIKAKLNEAFEEKASTYLAPTDKVKGIPALVFVNRVKKLLLENESVWSSEFLMNPIATGTDGGDGDEPTPATEEDYLFSDFRVTGPTDTTSPDSNLAFAYNAVKAMKNLGYISGSEDPLTKKLVLNPTADFTTAQLFSIESEILNDNGVYTNIDEPDAYYAENQLQLTNWVENAFKFMMTVYGNIYKDDGAVGKKMAEQIFEDTNDWLRKGLTKGQAAALIGNIIGNSNQSHTEYADWNTYTNGLGAEYVGGLAAAVENKIVEPAGKNLNLQNKITKVDGIVMLYTLYNLTKTDAI